MNKYIKLSMLGAIVIFIIAAIIVQMNSYSPEIYNEAEKAFNILETAFKEDRPLTEYERMKLKPFLEMLDEYVDNYESLSKKEKKDAALLCIIGRMYESYPGDLDTFKEYYEYAKILLD